MFKFWDNRPWWIYYITKSNNRKINEYHESDKPENEQNNGLSCPINYSVKNNKLVDTTNCISDNPYYVLKSESTEDLLDTDNPDGCSPNLCYYESRNDVRLSDVTTPLINGNMTLNDLSDLICNDGYEGTPQISCNPPNNFEITGSLYRAKIF